MTEPDAPDLPPPLADRACGGCTVCCVALTIEDKDLQKVQGYRCPHMKTGQGCGIYDTRPGTCREFYCGWRQLKWVRGGLRPDVSGVLFQLRRDLSAAIGAQRIAVSVTLLTRAALQAEGLAESIAAGVAAGVPVFLVVPGPPGYTSAQAQINDHVHEAVRTRDKAGLLRILAEMYREARRGDFRRIVIEPNPDGGGVKAKVAPRVAPRGAKRVTTGGATAVRKT
ncbi:MAG: YkgJ family cysteine cluster protein [Rhodospirillales bacterium]|nr:YkgJ family cysteine cluster protein [Rhodospirillales bacterium]